MQSFKIPAPVHGCTYNIVGDCNITLRKIYDSAQLWFSFMAGTVFRTSNNTTPSSTITVNPQPRFHASVPANCRQIYEYKQGIEQYVLPFVEYRRVSHSQLRLLAPAKFPTWDKTAEGVPYQITILDKPFDPVEWCHENCVGRFHVTRRIIIFEKESDALVAKLVFS